MKPDRLYEWTAESKENRYNGLAVGLRETEDGVVFWDTNRDRVLNGKVQDHGPQVVVETETFRLEFQEVTLNRWFEYWVNQMSPGMPEFETDSEMHEWYVRFMNEG